jgi:hypothetical protein
MHGHDLIEFFAKNLPSLAVCITFGSVNAVGQLDNCHSREG